MTSTLVLFLIYLGFIALWRAVEDPRVPRGRRRGDAGRGDYTSRSSSSPSTGGTRCTRAASVLRIGGPTMDRAFLIPLLIMAVAFSLLFVTLHLAAMRNEILRRRVRSLQMMQASRGALKAKRVPVRVRQTRQNKPARHKMSLGPYTYFIVTSYTVVAAVVLILIGWIRARLSQPEGPPARAGSQRHRAALRPRRGGLLMSTAGNRHAAARPALAGDATADRLCHARRAVPAAGGFMAAIPPKFRRR